MRKLAKSRVRYRLGSSSKHCGNCVMFRRVFLWFGTCTLVAGPILDGDVCDRWEGEK